MSFMLSAPPLFAYSGTEIGVRQSLRLVVQQFINRESGDAGHRFQIFNRGRDLAAQPIRHSWLPHPAETREVGLQHALLLQVSLKALERFSRIWWSSHSVNIGDSDSFAIGQTYIGLPQTRQMEKKPAIGTFWDRVKEALGDAARAKKTHNGVRIKPTQVFAAKIAEVKQPTVSDWNKPGKAPELDNALKLALALDVCIEWLYTGRGPKRPGIPLDRYAQQLWELWPQLTDGERGKLLGIALGSVPSADPVAPRPFSRDPTAKEGLPKRGS